MLLFLERLDSAEIQPQIIDKLLELLDNRKQQHQPSEKQSQLHNELLKLKQLTTVIKESDLLGDFLYMEIAKIAQDILIEIDNSKSLEILDTKDKPSSIKISYSQVAISWRARSRDNFFSICSSERRSQHAKSENLTLRHHNYLLNAPSASTWRIYCNNTSGSYRQNPDLIFIHQDTLEIGSKKLLFNFSVKQALIRHQAESRHTHAPRSYTVLYCILLFFKVIEGRSPQFIYDNYPQNPDLRPIDEYTPVASGKSLLFSPAAQCEQLFAEGLKMKKWLEPEFSAKLHEPLAHLTPAPTNALIKLTK